MEIKYLNEDCEKISKRCDLEFGKEIIPLTPANNLLNSDPSLNTNGFGLFTLRKPETFTALEQYITGYIQQQLGIYQEPVKGFELCRYHQYLQQEETHYKISTWGLEYQMLGNAFYEILQQAEDLLQLKLKVKKINHLGKEGDYVGFRILRPLRNDHNPFHRDAWLPYWRDTVNVWLPICGFENGNTLQLIPKSHLWSDDQILKTKIGAEIEGKKYHVPAAIGTVNNFSIETPVLKKGDGLIFSPYLIHGNGRNHKTDETRVSLEFRFCKA